MMTIPATAVRILRCATSDYPVTQDLVTRARIAAARPALADDMRVATLCAYIDDGQGYVEVVEHTDPLTTDATVTRVSTVDASGIEAEIERMRDAGAVPAYLATAALADLSYAS
jgi:hypothetical protein